MIVLLLFIFIFGALGIAGAGAVYGLIIFWRLLFGRKQTRHQQPHNVVRMTFKYPQKNPWRTKQ